MMLHNKMLSIAAKEVGVKEPTGEDKYIKWYNSVYKTGFNMSTPWCCIFVSWVANQAGVPTSIIKHFASCTQMTNWFSGQGLFKKYPAYTPKPGDLIMYDWDKSGDSDHVGFVESVNGKSVVTIEGNYSDSVKRRTINIATTTIRGFCLPDFPIGDVNDDGKVTADDAMTVLNASVGKVSLSAAQKRDADVNNDGKINATDALDILQKASGKVK